MTPDPRLVHQASINVMREILATIDAQAEEIARLRGALEKIVAYKSSLDHEPGCERLVEFCACPELIAEAALTEGEAG